MTTREEIAAGPQFKPTPIHGEALCACCRALDHVDLETGLCRPCWRAFVFGPRYNQGQP